MRASQNDGASPYLAVDHGRITLAAINIQLLFKVSEHFDSPLPHLQRVNKDPAPVVIRPEALRQDARRPKRLLPDADSDGPRAAFARIPKTLECATPTGAREEGQLAGTDDLHAPVGAADLELAAGGSIVATGTETEVGAAATYEGVDDAVPRAIEDAAVVEVGAARDDEEGGGGGPGLSEEGRLSQGDDGVIRGEQAAEGVDALPYRGDSCAGACDRC